MRRHQGGPKKRCDGKAITSWLAKPWRGARAVEWDGLENRCGSLSHRGFESHPLRHYPSGRPQGRPFSF